MKKIIICAIFLLIAVVAKGQENDTITILIKDRSTLIIEKLEKNLRDLEKVHKEEKKKELIGGPQGFSFIFVYDFELDQCGIPRPKAKQKAIPCPVRSKGNDD